MKRVEKVGGWRRLGGGEDRKLTLGVFSLKCLLDV